MNMKNILLVEESSPLRKIRELLLTNEGYVVRSTDSIEVAAALLFGKKVLEQIAIIEPPKVEEMFEEYVCPRAASCTL